MSSHVQTVLAQGGPATSVTTAAITTTSGDTVVLSGGNNASGDTLTVQDSKTNTWTQHPNSPKSPTTQVKACSFYCLSITGGSGHTFTLNSNNAHDMTLFASDLSGIDSLNQTNGNTQTATTAPTSGTTGTRDQAEEMLFGSFSANEVVVNPTAGSGFTIPTNGHVDNGAVSVPGAVEYQHVSAVGTDAAIFATNSCDVGTFIYTFRDTLPSSAVSFLLTA